MKDKKKNRRDHRLGRYRLMTAEMDPRGFKKCVYCGEPANTVDHQPPISRIDDYESLGLANELYVLIPSCMDCNKLAGSVLHDSPIERLEYIKDSLEKRLKKYLNQVEWDEEELKDIGPNLKSKILEDSNKKLTAINRIEYYSGYDLIIDTSQELLYAPC